MIDRVHGCKSGRSSISLSYLAKSNYLNNPLSTDHREAGSVSVLLTQFLIKMSRYLYSVTLSMLFTFTVDLCILL